MNKPSLRTPTEQDAITIVQTMLQRSVHKVQRFPTGLCHYVYAVATDDQQEVVVRIARPETEALLAGGVFWSRLLRPLGAPLPALLYADLEATIVPFAFMLLERLPGLDLGHVYRHLSRAEKGSIAAELARIQVKISQSLPPGNGFGCTTSLLQPLPHRTWMEFIEQSLLDSQQKLAQVGVMDPGHTERVWQRLSRFRAYLDQVAPTPFLDDITTKNVLVHNGQLSGIVDVDEISYGDPLFVVAQTQMPLLKAKEGLDYIAAWTDCLQLTPEQHRVLQFYTAVCCVNFMSELDQTFNKGLPEPADEAMVQHLTHVLDDLLEMC
jgi:Ser/Thr protein kinase RdoA (MazF antagonist)